ncbi:hypothetical protein KKA96_04135 [Patescibacteria group bacterium]|nr:hypothetical protein [Patescibacteria group bacterium]
MLSEAFDLFAISGIMLAMIIFIPLVRWHNSRYIQVYYKKMAKIHLDNARRLCEITDVGQEIEKIFVFLYDFYPYLLLNTYVTLGDIGSSNGEIRRIREKGEKAWAREPLIRAYKKSVRPNLTI